MNALSCPPEDRPEELIRGYSVARQKFLVKSRTEPRAPDGMLKRICEEGAWFCTFCVRFDYIGETARTVAECKRCDRPMKWRNRIF